MTTEIAVRQRIALAFTRGVEGLAEVTGAFPPGDEGPQMMRKVAETATATAHHGWPRILNGETAGFTATAKSVVRTYRLSCGALSGTQRVTETTTR